MEEVQSIILFPSAMPREVTVVNIHAVDLQVNIMLMEDTLINLIASYDLI